MKVVFEKLLKSFSSNGAKWCYLILIMEKSRQIGGGKLVPSLNHCVFWFSIAIHFNDNGSVMDLWQFPTA